MYRKHVTSDATALVDDHVPVDGGRISLDRPEDFEVAAPRRYRAGNDGTRRDGSVPDGDVGARRERDLWQVALDFLDRSVVRLRLRLRPQARRPAEVERERGGDGCPEPHLTGSDATPKRLRGGRRRRALRTRPPR
jgi:hypothetical protein